MTAPVLPGAEPWSATGTEPLGALCIHGFTGNPSSMRGVAEAFAAAGFHVELPRLPGHGTVVDDMIGARWDDWVAEAEAAYQRLAARVERVVVAGLSMGGTLSLRIAADHPEVAGLVLVNPAAQPFAVEVIELVQGMVADGQELMPGIGSDIADPDATESAYEGTPLRALLSFAVDGIEPVSRQYPSMSMPLLLITSRNDHVVDPASSDFLAEQYGGPVQRILLDRSYHVATQDYDRELIFTEAVSFAQKLLSR
jgi:carboxylesterase